MQYLPPAALPGGAWPAGPAFGEETLPTVGWCCRRRPSRGAPGRRGGFLGEKVNEILAVKK